MVNVLGLLTERGIGSCAEWEDRVRAAGSRDNFQNNPSEEGRRSDRGHRDSTLGRTWHPGGWTAHIYIPFYRHVGVSAWLPCVCGHEMDVGLIWNGAVHFSERPLATDKADKGARVRAMHVGSTEAVDTRGPGASLESRGRRPYGKGAAGRHLAQC